ncbi:MAG: hypothetical protein LBK63_03340 [Treponema sp.]|jgi:hypothetical protein|nr:hypothetical protein [Treponema sp.]
MHGVAWLPALIGAAVSVGLSRSGFLGFLFLLPLGLVAYCYNPRTAWFAAAAAAAGNVLFSLVAGGLQSYRALSWALPLADMFYLTVVIGAFVWITSPPERGGGFLRMPTAYRIVAGAAMTSLALGLALYSAQEDQGLRFLFRSQAEMLASLYVNASAADEVRRSLTEQYMSADVILEILRSVALRGGIVVSCVALFMASRQISLIVAFLIRRKQVRGSLIAFHVRPECVWVLSFSLLAILGGLGLGIEPLEIAGWNILVLCAILYLAQGGGITIFFLIRLSPALRVALNLGVLALMLSPGINVAFMGVLILLGVAENWVPFRAPKPNGPPPTPGA